MTDKTVSNTSPLLVALPFSEDIKRLTDDFVGREWVFEQIAKWIHDSDETFFLLTGEAGIGKSAIAARLTQIRGDVAAYHFCISGRASTIVPGAILRSIAAQLGKNLPDYGLALAKTISPTYLSINVKIDVGVMNGGQITGVVINNLAIADPKQETESLLTAPLSAMPAPKDPVLIVLDSLDEAFTYNPGENIVTLLAGLTNLPRWARIILTSRPDKRVLNYFASVPTHVVPAESQMNREDLRLYVDHRVRKSTLGARIRDALNHITKETLAEQVVGVGADPGLADGNFLYTKILLDDIESGAQPLDDLAALPKSLDEIYQRFLLRLQPEWESRYQPLLAVLAVAREPLTGEQLVRFGNQGARMIGGSMSATLVNLALSTVAQFLDPPDKPGQQQYALFHQSLRDYLLNPIRSGYFACPPEDGHGAIAEEYLGQPVQDWSKCEMYGLRHLPTHLKGAGQIERLNELLTDFDWLSNKLERMDVAALVSDYELTDNAEATILKDALRLSTYALVVDKAQLAGQLVGRLASFDNPTIRKLTQRARDWEDGVWLCPLTPSLTPPGSPLVRVLSGRLGGHLGTVRSLAITPDGQRAISAGNSSNDRTVRIWDLVSGMCLYTLQEQAAGGFTPLALAGTGKRAFTGFQDQVRAWNLVTGAQQATLTQDSDQIIALATTSDGNRVIIGTEGGSVCVWDMTADSIDLAGHGEPVFAVAISDDGRWAASVSSSMVKAWDLTTRKERLTLEISVGRRGGWGDAHLLGLAADGSQVLFGDPPRSWDVESGTVADLPGLPLGCEILDMSLNSKRALVKPSVSEETAIGVWDLELGEKLFELQSKNRVATAKLTPDGKRAISADFEHNLNVWDLSDDMLRMAQTTTGMELRFEEFAPRGNSALFRLPDGRGELYSLNRNGITLAPGPYDALMEELSSNAKRRNDTLKRVAKKLKLIEKYGYKPILVVSEDGQRALSAFRLLFKSGDFEEPVRGEGTSQYEEITLWDLRGKPSAISLRGHRRPILTLAMTPDGRWAISAGWGRLVRVWDLEARSERWVLRGHTGLVGAAAITADGRRAASASEDGTLRLWNLETGQPLAVFSGESWLSGCWLSLEGDAVIAAERTTPGKFKFHILRLCGE